MFYLPLKNTFLATWKLVCFRQNTHYSSGGLIPLQGPGGLTLQVNPEAGVPSAGGQKSPTLQPAPHALTQPGLGYPALEWSLTHNEGSGNASRNCETQATGRLPPATPQPHPIPSQFTVQFLPCLPVIIFQQGPLIGSNVKFLRLVFQSKSCSAVKQRWVTFNAAKLNTLISLPCIGELQSDPQLPEHIARTRLKAPASHREAI